MKCPECGTKQTIQHQLVMFNPKKVKCKECHAVYSYDRKGIIANYIFNIASLVMVLIYIYMIIEHIGSSATRGTIFFGYLTPATIIYLWIIRSQSPGANKH